MPWGNDYENGGRETKTASAPTYREVKEPAPDGGGRFEMEGDWEAEMRSREMGPFGRPLRRHVPGEMPKKGEMVVNEFVYDVDEWQRLNPITAEDRAKWGIDEKEAFDQFMFEGEVEGRWVTTRKLINSVRRAFDRFGGWQRVRNEAWNMLVRIAEAEGQAHGLRGSLYAQVRPRVSGIMAPGSSFNRVAATVSDELILRFATMEFISKEIEKDADVPKDPTPDWRDRDRGIPVTKDQSHTPHEITRNKRYVPSVSLPGLAPDGSALRKEFRNSFRQGVTDLGADGLRNATSNTKKKDATDYFLGGLKGVIGTVLGGDLTGANAATNYIWGGKEPETGVDRAAVHGLFGAVDLQAGELYHDKDNNILQTLNNTTSGLGVPGVIMDTANDYLKKNPPVVGTENEEPFEEFFRGFDREFDSIDWSNLEAALHSAIALQQGGRNEPLTAGRRYPPLQGSVLSTTAPWGPLGAGEANIKSAPIYNSNMVPDEEVLFRQGVQQQNPKQGDILSEKMNDPRGRKLQTSIETRPEVEGADAFHPNHFYEPVVNPRIAYTNLARRRAVDQQNEPYTWAWNEPSLRNFNRDTEVMVPFTYDLSENTALPAQMDPFTISDNAPKPYVPSTIRMGPQLYDAPQLVGVGWDDRQPPPDPSTVSHTTSSTVSTTGAPLVATGKAPRADQDNLGPPSQPNGVVVDVGHSRDMNPPGAPILGKSLRRKRDQINAANQTNPFQVKSQITRPQESVPANIGRSM